MTIIYLHIGTHKTGTTSIQRLMALSYDDLLENGILYPLAGRPTQISGHHRLAWSILGSQGEQDEQCWHDLMAEIRSVDPNRVVLSAEGFEVSNPAQIERIRQFLEPYEVKIIVYLRNQLSYMVSAYKETIKSGQYSHTFLRFIQNRSARLDYLRLVKRWGRVFGMDNVDIRLYDRVKTDPGLIEDFLSRIGADPQKFREKREPRVNVSPPNEFVALLRHLNKINERISPGFLNSLLNGMRKSLLRKKTESNIFGRTIKKLISPKLYEERDVAWLRDFVHQPNQAFMDGYISNEDRHFFDF